MFRRLGEQQAEFIRNDGLHATAPSLRPNTRWAQVHRTAYEPLARINLAGLLTYDSQDAVNSYTGKVKSWERPYIQDAMLPDDALRFVNNINMWNHDKIALICMKMPDYPIVGAEIAVTRAFDEGSRTWIATRTMDACTVKDWIDDIRLALHMPESVKFSVIQVFDTNWGRPARSKKGLFNAVLKALDPAAVHPCTPDAPITFIKRGRADDEKRYQEWRAGFSKE